LVHEMGLEALRADVESEFESIRHGVLRLPEEEIRRIEAYFAPPPFETLPEEDPAFDAALAADPAFARWVNHNIHPHKVPGYASVTIALKPIGGTPGDA